MSRSVAGDAGADHVDAVEGGLGVDLVVLAGDGEGGVGDGDVQVLFHFVLIGHGTDFQADLIGPDQPPGGYGGGDGGQELFGRGEQFAAFAGAFDRQ